MQRQSVFLEEMGLGVQWRLRGRAPQAALADAVEAAPEPAPAPVPEPAVAPPPVAMAAPAAVAAQPQAIAAQTEPAAAAPIVPAPAIPSAPGTAPTAPQRSAPAEDTSWFDDAPAPPARPAPQPAPAAAPASIADMDWPALQAAVRACTRCGLCASRERAVPGRGDQEAGWLVLGTMPDAYDEAEGRPFTGEAGELLDNMLRAVQQSTEQGAYLTSLVKCRADRAPTDEEVAACRPYLERELALTGARVVLTLGHGAAKGLLGSAARGRIMQYQAAPVVATYHPADLLAKPEDKAKAWQDLCLAKAAHAGRR